MSKSKLKVTPIKNPYRAKYPSHSDVSPLQFPEQYPYPFSMRFVRKVQAIGFVGVIAMAGCKTATKSNKPEYLENTFTLDRTELPYWPSMFGTGAPMRLKNTHVIEAMNQVFSEEGLQVMKDTFIQIKGHYVPVDAIDLESGIGYAYIDYREMGEGLVNSYDEKRVKTRAEILEGHEKRLDVYVKRYKKDGDSFFNSHFGRRNKNDALWVDKMKNELNDLEPSERPKKLREILHEYHILGMLERIKERESESIYLQWQKSALDILEDPLEQYVYVNLIAGISVFKEPSIKRTAIAQFINSKFLSTSKKEWVLHTKALLGLLSHNFDYNLIQTSQYNEFIADVISNVPIREWEDQYSEISRIYDIHTLTMDELHCIEESNQYKIAPVSVRDRRMEYEGALYHELQGKMDSLESEMYHKDGSKNEEVHKEYKALRDEMRNNTDYYNQQAIEYSLQQLQDDMRKYIQWAKSQVGY